MTNDNYTFGIYEKALPDRMSWPERLRAAGEAGYSFIEISIDETDQRLSRLDWDNERRLELVHQQMESGVKVQSMCLSGHRRFPIGSADSDLRNSGMMIMKKAIEFASDTGIRVVQLAGYDCAVNEKRTDQTRQLFHDNLSKSVTWASKSGVILALENIGPALVDSVTSAMGYVREFNSPYLQVYPDVGNLDAAGFDIQSEISAGIGYMAGIHIKDTKKGHIRRVPFGDGNVDFVKAFRSISHSGYQGPLLVEMWADDRPDAEKAIREARIWIEERMKAVL
jgi:L-ribulose-5-phosphate 3-epimerase